MFFRRRARAFARTNVKRRERARNSRRVPRRGPRPRISAGRFVGVYADIYGKLTRERERARLPDMREKIKFGQG